MKKSLVVSSIALLILLVNSCEIEVPPRYFEVNGRESKINNAYMNDWGPGEDLRYRWWVVSFRSEEIMPGDYITFQIASYENKEDGISEGTYEYDYLGGEGFFNDIAIGYDISYDSKGYQMGNLLADEFADFSGYIDVERDGTTDKYHFTFDMEVTYHDEFYTITGEFEGIVKIGETEIDLETY